MSENAEVTTSNQLTLFAEDSLANRTASPAGAKPQTMTATCGLNMPASFAKLSQRGFWLRMYRGYYQATMGDFTDEFCQTWPRAGMMLSGECFERSILEHPTSESAYSLWPTPVKSDGMDANFKIHSMLKSARRSRERGGAAKLSWIIAEVLGLYLRFRFSEWLMGFPEEWTQIN